jgi:hypothetical protein
MEFAGAASTHVEFVAIRQRPVGGAPEERCGIWVRREQTGVPGNRMPGRENRLKMKALPPDRSR